tara:strand:+ start:14633 stop:15628 length:996 start_codon:yes stop_codon:yes gene_type:complete
METEDNKERIEQIYSILMEFASGNFAYKLKRTDLNDEIETITALINMTFEEIKDSFLHQGYTNQNKIHKHFVKIFFVLNMEDTIVAYNSRIKELLFFDDNELQEKAFSSFLTEDSLVTWNSLKSKLALTDLSSYEEYIVLSFKTKQHLIVTTNCLVSKFVDAITQSERILVTSVEIIIESKERDIELQKTVRSGKDKSNTDKDTNLINHKSTRSSLSSNDIRKIREVHDHIVNNLEKPLSSLIDLAHSFGTNEYKLKYGFKELYGQTVFRFLIHERLKNASLLIQHTDIPLKEVAHTIGFISVTHFSKSFKDKYGYTPSDLRKQTYHKPSD